MKSATILRESTELFRQGLTELFDTVDLSDLSPERFETLIKGLKAVANQASLAALQSSVEASDRHDVALLRRAGTTFRFKVASTKQWLTPFGVATVSRRYYQPDVGGDGVIPLDEQCGMVDRYCTPDVEEMVAYASALMVPREVETLLGKALGRGPSATAIGRVIADVGQFVESHEESIEEAIIERAPLSLDGDVLVISQDGVTVPMREQGVRCGRPAERPGIRDRATSPTRWREAGVGTVSIYAPPKDGEKTPQRVDGRVFARMPEPHMQTLERQMEAVVWDLTQVREFREVVLICDGKRTLWDDLCAIPTYEKATKILDVYHVAEHLSRAAEAIFGKQESSAKKWFETYRHRLVHEDAGVDVTIRSLRHHRGKLRRGSQRDDVVRRVIRYLTRNRDKVRYAEYRRRGLPIGSGPVEAACKTIVNGRLKRSGMRWSQDGGQQVLNLRTAVKSNRWNALWSVYQGAALRQAA